MALAIHCDELIQNGALTDQSELARFGQVTTARTTQILSLLALAPDIQECILFLPRTTKGREVVKETDIREIAAVLDWRKQRRLWATLRDERLFLPTVRNESSPGSEPDGVANKQGVPNPRAREFAVEISDRRRQPSDSAFPAGRTRERLALRSHRNFFH